MVSAHRTPDRLYDYAKSAKARGLKVIIAGAGGAAHLPGMTASMTTLPVLGVPVHTKALSGQDSLLSIVQMPAGVPVGTLAIGDARRHQRRAAGRADPGAGGRARWRSGSRRCAPSRRRRFPRRRKTMPDAGRPVPLPPGSTIGILGSGQLGRMLAMAAARLGLKTHIYCEDERPGLRRRQPHHQGRLRRCRRRSTRSPAAVDVVTYEFENVPLRTARHLAARVPVQPGARALEVAQDRLAEKEFIAGLGDSGRAVLRRRQPGGARGRDGALRRARRS